MTRALLLSAVGFLVSVSVAGAQKPACTPEERREGLRTLQHQVLELAPRQIESLEAATRPGAPLAGWVYSHGHVVMAHTGAVPLASRAAKEPMPQLLQYAPSPTTSPRDWLDFDGDDGPYHLVGWAYLAPFDPHGPPSRRCIDPSEWFVHDAGWHLMDGSMVATPDATVEPPRQSCRFPYILGTQSNGTFTCGSTTTACRRSPLRIPTLRVAACGWPTGSPITW